MVRLAVHHHGIDYPLQHLRSKFLIKLMHLYCSWELKFCMFNTCRRFYDGHTFYCFCTYSTHVRTLMPYVYSNT